MASPQNTPAAPQNTPADTAPAPPLNWRYPFPAKDGKEITDPQIFYGALGAMSDGFFPLGVNGFPHGGIHFGAASASRLDQSKGVRVIADGDIVAFKIDDAYPHLRYTQTRDWAWYSTGFVLVRHTMTMPRAPESTGPQPADETLTFFSLYMHMADWATYLADGKLARPGWWPNVDVFRIGTKDRQIGGGTTGAFVYSAPIAGSRQNTFTAGQQVGFLPEGSEVTISETRGAWGHIKAIMAGTMISPISGGRFGTGDQAFPWVQPDDDFGGTCFSLDPTSWVPPPAMAHITPEGDWGWIKLHDQQALKEPTVGVGAVCVPPKSQPIHVSAGTLLGQLGEYVDYETSTPLPPIPARQLLHVEVFADESLQSFIEKSRKRAAQLPASDRTVFVIQAGTKLVAKPAGADLNLGAGPQLAKLTLTTTSPKIGPWVQVQPWINSPSGRPQQYQSPVWIARSALSRLDSPNGLQAWKSFPLQLSQVGSPVNADLVTYPTAELNALGDGNVALDDKGVPWWRLEVGTGSGQSPLGWVCGGKQSDGSATHPGTQWASPWAWPGFEIVDATGINLTDAFKRNLSVTGSANPKEQKAFAPSTAAVGNSALLAKLEQTVSRLPTTGGAKDQQGKDGSVVVTAVKLRQALGRRWLASDLGHVILKYESEWGGGMSRWEALTPLMRNAAENWKCELERIRKLQWWDSVKGNVERFPSSPVVNHIHPVAIVGNFAASCFPLSKTQEMAILITSSFEGSNSTVLKYDAVAGNFDQMGMSFGVVQWNFGSGTLAPVFNDMISADEAAFKACFDNLADYNSLAIALSSSIGAQKQWAINQQHNNPSGWMKPFQKIGANDAFNKIQLKHATTYHANVIKCISWLRGLRADLMEKIEVQTYCALYDLSVQQSGLSSAKNAITARVQSESPSTQNQFLIIAVEERAKTALPAYRADCLSRRRGVLQQQVFIAPHIPRPIMRDNVNFPGLKQIAREYVCDL